MNCLRHPDGAEFLTFHKFLIELSISRFGGDLFDRIIESFSQPIQFLTRFVVQAPPKWLSAAIGCEQSRLVQDIFFNGKESVEPRLKLQADQSTDGKIQAIDRFLILRL